MQIIYAGASDVGKVRDHNEDAYAVIPEVNLIMVCDGMGGHAAGEVASEMAVETISAIFKDQDLQLFAVDGLPYPEEISPEGKLLVGAIAVANHRIIEVAKESTERSGMGTTVVACHFQNGVVSICHVGDSRAYLIRQGNIRRVTIDHSWVSEVMEKHHLTEEESENLVNRNVITRALGTRPTIKTDISQIRFQKDDLFLLCSDGLCGMISDSEILKAANAGADDLNQLAQVLIAKANEAGGSDNITVCIARVIEQGEIPDFDEIRRATVDWGTDKELAQIEQIAHSKFPDTTEAPPQPAGSTVGFTVPVRKKHDISPLLWIAILIVALAAVLFILLK